MIKVQKPPAMYSWAENKFAVIAGMVFAGSVGLFCAYHTVVAVGYIVRLGISINTVRSFLIPAGVALMGLSTAAASLIYLLRPTDKSCRWLLVLLVIGGIMALFGFAGLFA